MVGYMYGLMIAWALELLEQFQQLLVMYGPHMTTYV